MWFDDFFFISQNLSKKIEKRWEMKQGTIWRDFCEGVGTLVCTKAEKTHPTDWAEMKIMSKCYEQH